MKDEPPYTSPKKALIYFRDEYFGERISYRKMAEHLSDISGETVPKSEPWNVMHDKYKCPKRLKKALYGLGLLKKRKRYRFFYEVGPNEYYRLKAYLEDRGISFTEFVREMREDAKFNRELVRRLDG